MVEISTYLLYFLTALYGFIVGGFIIGWFRIKKPYPLKKSGFTTKVSIIVTARNEESKIEACLRDILAQDYPEDLIELLVMDDHSTDKTADVAESIQDKRLKVTRLYDDKVLVAYKKRAITEAIKMSTGSLIITTDADCRMGKLWLASIVNEYEQGDFKFISGPVAYFDESNFFQKLQTAEFFYLIGIGASCLGNKIPGNCNGANIAYEKAVFNEVGGYKGIDDIASGDDELLLHKIMAIYPNQITFLKSKDALVQTAAKETWAEFIAQRRRWASKATRYKSKYLTAIALGIFVVSLALLIAIPVAVFVPALWTTILICFALKMPFDMFFGGMIAVFFGKGKFIPYGFLVIPIHPIYFILVGILAQRKQYEWKGRMVK